ncbi:MAG: LON peptidase substrate-binding domain-containing protein, partial [Candidatus Marithrix sp.]|nr:LON peptidase substrate-binding domain-containing protein [Candidatus Marithrix sp.]
MNDEIIFDSDELKTNEKRSTEIVKVEDKFPETLHILPLTNRPFFPHQIIPLIIEKDLWENTVKAITDSSHNMLGLLLSKKNNIENIRPNEFYKVGTVCRLHR